MKSVIDQLCWKGGKWAKLPMVSTLQSLKELFGTDRSDVASTGSERHLSDWKNFSFNNTIQPIQA